jgi:rare lipoprotein A
MPRVYVCKLFLFFLANLPVVTQGQTSVHTITGTASYYSEKFEGRRCANGEIFHHSAFTAAHKSFPFGTLVIVTNIKNDSAAIVRINDRLPRNSKHCIDVTRAAAGKLGFINEGITQVRIQPVRDTAAHTK